MASRLKQTIPGTLQGFEVRIYWNAEYREWSARLVICGKLDGIDGAAFDSDQESVVATGRHMLQLAERRERLTIALRKAEGLDAPSTTLAQAGILRAWADWASVQQLEEAIVDAAWILNRCKEMPQFKAYRIVEADQETIIHIANAALLAREAAAAAQA